MRLGTLVGTRTVHRLRPAASNLLDDGSPLALPANGQLRADQELINGIGVPPGYYLPLTAQGPPAGEDPAIAQALTLLGGRPGAPGADARREGTATAIGRPVPLHPSGRKSQPQSCRRLVGRPAQPPGIEVKGQSAPQQGAPIRHLDWSIRMLQHPSVSARGNHPGHRFQGRRRSWRLLPSTTTK